MHFNQCLFWFQAEPLPIGNLGPDIVTTSQGDGLIMTNEKGVYTFKCSSKTACKWSKETYSLQISRYWHVMLPVSISFLENCWWNKL